MKHLQYHILAATIAAFAIAGTSTRAHSAVIPTEEAGPELPPIWAEASPSQRHQALEAAELDANRLLAERVYGLEIESGTRISDLVFDGSETAGNLSAFLRGAVESAEPRFLPDGTVLAFRAVKLREVVKTVSKATKGKVLSDGSIEPVSANEKTSISNNDSVIDVTGNSALPGSEGHAKILAKRAAELDAYRRLAATMIGIKINGETTVRDLALENDRVTSALAAVLKGAETKKVAYDPLDASCKVTMSLKIADVIRTTVRAVGTDKIKTTINDEIEEQSFTATGRGVMREIGSGDQQAASSAEPPRPETSREKVDPFFETTTIIREVLRTEAVIHGNSPP
jgi:hypothetical protein